jgi:hypothetical protein
MIRTLKETVGVEETPSILKTFQEGGTFPLEEDGKTIESKID